MTIKMMPFGVFTAALMAGVLLPGADVRAEFSAEQRAELAAAHKALGADVEATPATADWGKYVTEHYAANAQMLPANGEAVVGREAITAFFKSFPGITRFKTEDLEIDGDGDVAFIRGVYELTLAPPDSPPINDKGKYVEIWRKQADGKWQCTHDIFNSDLPVAAPAPEPAPATPAAKSSP